MHRIHRLVQQNHDIPNNNIKWLITALNIKTIMYIRHAKRLNFEQSCSTLSLLFINHCLNMEISFIKHFSTFLLVCNSFSHAECFNLDHGNEDLTVDIIGGIVKRGIMSNGFKTILCMGDIDNKLFQRISLTNNTITLYAGKELHYIQDVVPHHAQVIIIDCLDFEEFEKSIKIITASPYWYPLANVVIFYHGKVEMLVNAKIFFILWFYRVINAVILQNEQANSFLLMQSNPYSNEKYRLQYNFGCWTAKLLTRPIRTFEEGFKCVEGCHNITIDSKLRASNLGTCIGIDTYILNISSNLNNIILFDDKAKNLHGHTFRGYVRGVEPFTVVEEKNGKFQLSASYGLMWNNFARIHNFSMEFFLTRETANDISIQEHFNNLVVFHERRWDLYLFPIYMLDLMFLKLDYTVPIADGGLCLVAHESGFETILFDAKLLQENYLLLIQFILCLLCILFTFSLFYATEGNFSADLIGKSLMNTIRNALSISIINPPRFQSFRIFLFTSIWAFFLLNFATQAAIISFFSAFKKGKNMETFEDVLRKGYNIEGVLTPDVPLPDTEERYRLINSKLLPAHDIYECIDKMANSSHRVCLLDCATALYTEKHRFNSRGEQFLHIMKDKMHSYYRAAVFHDKSPLTKHFNRYMTAIVESGIIKKWEEQLAYRAKDEAVIKPLGMEDLLSIFKCYVFLVSLCILVFIGELLIGKLCDRVLVQ